MKILIVGHGGREHALLWKLHQDHPQGSFYITQGNGGTEELARSVPIGPQEIESLALFALREGIDLTVVGPEGPLASGIVDQFTERGLRIFGPGWRAAKIETSKAYAKHLMRRYGIPTPRFEDFDDPRAAREYVELAGAPLVIKADGLAGGKGSSVCRTRDEALRAIQDLMVERKYGEAGQEVVIEEYLEGEELSFIALCDGYDLVPLIPAQDHKRALDGDQGPNTGGMGAYAPVSIVDRALEEEIIAQILRPTLKALAQEGRPYRGVLYAGLMLTAEGPRVIEFNCRFGDPETQAVLPLLESNLLDLILAAVEGHLGQPELRWRVVGTALSVVMASSGYPGDYRTGFEILIPEYLQAEEGCWIFHAGTRRENGRLLTAGGRVLAVTALGQDIAEAAQRCYRVVEEIQFQGRHFRRDIGFRELKRLAERRR